MQTPDPLIGTTITERYEIVSLIKSGGMGAVYRARQHTLERDVAIKLLRPDVVGPSSVARFMAEAHAASRLNHPNVVSVFDFGRTPESEGELLFLVMELVPGLDLFEVLTHVGMLPLHRVQSVVCQTLQALAEAHHFGIVHRDVKPANITLTPTRAGADHVKVIDFGIAQLQSGARITDARCTCGTPEYIAPELVLGETATPASDLYSTGVLLFELLTGQLPFDGPTLASTFFAHVAQPPPDPRMVAPDREISDSMANLCLRALEKRPEKRFPNAQAFEQALSDAWRGAKPDSQEPSSIPNPAPSSHSRSRTMPFGASLQKARSEPPEAHQTGAPLIGRANDLAWARELLRDGRRWLELTGRAGIGRSRLAREIADKAAMDGARVVWIQLDPPPYGELSYRGLRQMIVELSGSSPRELASEDGRWPIELRAIEGLRLLFPPGPPRGTNPERTRRVVAAALSWAARRSAALSTSGRTLLCIDDIDRLDSASRTALVDHLRLDPVQRLAILSTSEEGCEEAQIADVASRRLAGLCRTDALRWMVMRGAAVALSRTDDDIEPLYLEQLCSLTSSSAAGVVPETLAGLIDARIQALDAAQRRVLQAVAIAGVLRSDKLTALLDRDPSPSSDGTMPSLLPLIDGKLLRIDERNVSIRHGIVGRAALSRAPAGAIAEIHAYAAMQIPSTPPWLELRAFHRIRAGADLGAFLAVEETARARANVGDGTGSIATLWQAVTTARMQIIRGEPDPATSALSIFGRKLATALIVEGRGSEARGILHEVLDVTEMNDLGRALVLEQLAALDQVGGHAEDAEQHRREALRIAQAGGDRDLADRIAAFLAHETPPPSRSDGRRARIPASHKPVLVVDDDRAIREGIEAVIRSDGRDAFTAANGAEALEVLQEIPRPGLILLDLMMPVMTGWELLEQLQRDEKLTDIPVVVVSAVSKRRETGAVRIIQKPVDATMLLDIVQEFCD